MSTGSGLGQNGGSGTVPVGGLPPAGASGVAISIVDQPLQVVDGELFINDATPSTPGAMPSALCSFVQAIQRIPPFNLLDPGIAGFIQPLLTAALDFTFFGYIDLSAPPATYDVVPQSGSLEGLLFVPRDHSWIISKLMTISGNGTFKVGNDAGKTNIAPSGNIFGNLADFTGATACRGSAGTAIASAGAMIDLASGIKLEITSAPTLGGTPSGALYILRGTLVPSYLVGL